jgi:hypothetical protein
MYKKSVHSRMFLKRKSEADDCGVELLDKERVIQADLLSMIGWTARSTTSETGCEAVRQS